MNKINEFLAKPFFNLGGMDVTPALVLVFLVVWLVVIKRNG